MKAIIYSRVSSKEQEDTGYSLDAQEKLLTEYSQGKYNIAKKFRITESASKWQIRKTLQEMLSFADKNGIDIILCEKIDRLTRSLKDAAIIDDWVHKKETREIHFVKEHFTLNANTKAHENFVWDMKVAVARFYTNNLSEEVRKGQKEKIAQGQLPTKPPLGYRTEGEKGRKFHVIDSPVAALIRRMFELYATGNYSLSRLEIEMYNLGLRTRSGRRLLGNRIHSLLTDPFYYGKMRWNGAVLDATHEPIISKDLFDKVQMLLKRQTRNPILTKHNSIFKGKIHCEHCAGLLTWEIQKGHWYGHCHNHKASRTCSKKTYIREEMVEEQVLDYFTKIAPKSHGMLSWIEEVIKSEFEQDTKKRELEIGRLNKLLLDVRQKKDRYYEAKIDQSAPIEFCDRKIDECLEEEESLKSALANASEQSDSYKELRIAMHRLAFYAREIYQQASVDDKRLLLSQIFTNLTQDGYKIKPKFTLAAEYLANWMPKLNQDYELDKMFTTQEKTGDFTPVSPSLLRG